MQKIETAKEYCPNDCIYRSYIDAGNTPICFYAVIEGKGRGCRISECDKYTAGTKVKPQMNKYNFIEWEYETDGENAHFVRQGTK